MLIKASPYDTTKPLLYVPHFDKKNITMSCCQFWFMASVQSNTATRCLVASKVTPTHSLFKSVRSSKIVTYHFITASLDILTTAQGSTSAPNFYPQTYKSLASGTYEKLFILRILNQARHLISILPRRNFIKLV